MLNIYLTLSDMTRKLYNTHDSQYSATFLIAPLTLSLPTNASYVDHTPSSGQPTHHALIELALYLAKSSEKSGKPGSK